MKTRLLIIFVIVISSLLGYVQYVDAFCSTNENWPDAPCYGCPGCYPGLEQEKIDWQPYYDFKGSEWMDSKKQEMIQAIQNDTLDEWLELTPNTLANHNVLNYYFLLGEAPIHDGMYFDQALEQENMDKLWKIVKLEFIDFPKIYPTSEPIQFVLEKTAYNNCNSYDAKITDKDGNFIWNEGVDVECNANVNPSLVTSKIKIGYKEYHPIIINESGKYYIEIEIDNMFTKREFVVRQNHGVVSPDPLCKSGPMPDGEGWVFMDCNWEQYADVHVDNCMRGKAPANNYAWSTQNCLWEWSPMRNENATGPGMGISAIDETKLCVGDTVLIDGVCQVIITHNVSIFSNKGFITFLIILVVLIPVSIGLVVYWKKRK